MNFIFAILLVSSVFSKEESRDSKILLPPQPGLHNDSTLEGIDSNNNNVRDDVEIFIWENITQDYKLYMAYLKFAETSCEKLKYENDIEKLKFYNIQENNDLSCINFYENERVISSRVESVYKKVYNSPQRKKAIKSISNKYNSYATSIKSYPKVERAKLCRF